MAEMTQSILLTTKKMLGIAEEYHAFDLDIIIHINSVFLNLNQLGVGPITPFQITGVDEVWSDFVDVSKVPGIQTYVYLKTRLLFDPPTNSFLVDNMQKQIAELEWRMNVQVETPPEVEEEIPEEPEVVDPPVIETPDPTPDEPIVTTFQFARPTTTKLSTNQMLINRLKEITKGVEKT